jgi:uncharacterized caspase-like protein
MISLRIITLLAAILAATGANANAEKRVALVIGNSSYQKVANLSNPANDAAAVAAMFKSAGFNAVDTKLNQTVSELRKTLRDFGNRTRDADVAVIYYAGHGIELDGTNYLIPTDATLETDADVLDEALSLDRVLFAVEPAKHLRLVILDACRDNPFTKTMKRTVGSRAIGRGLAKVEPSSPNTMIAFAAKAGSTASDGDSNNSPFAKALVEHLTKPGLDLRKAFGFVRDDVLKATNKVQEPFVYGSLGGDDVALVPIASVAPAVGAAAPADQDSSVRRDYEFAERVGTKPVWDAFIEKHPTGFYTALGKAQRGKLAAEGASLEATTKAKLAQEEQARLATEGAKATEQAKAGEQVKAAEKARVAAELVKKAQEAKVAEAERLKATALSKAAEKEAERTRAVEEGKVAAEIKAAAEKSAKERQVAALTPPPDKSDQDKTRNTYTAEDAQRVEAFAAKLNLKMPPFVIGETKSNVPASAAQFVGIWSSNIGFDGGKGRHGMLIVTEVSSATSNLALGFYLSGPPTKLSWEKNDQAGYAGIAGTITDGVLRFKVGATPMEAKLNSPNRMTMQSTNHKRPSQTAVIKFEPLWQLTPPSTAPVAGETGKGNQRMTNLEPTRARSEPSASKPIATLEGDARCNKMADKLGCLCAVRNGGGISTDGKSWYSKRGGSSALTNEAFVQCQIRAGRR